jgi:hypothetical protein
MKLYKNARNYILSYLLSALAQLYWNDKYRIIIIHVLVKTNIGIYVFVLSLGFITHENPSDVDERNEKNI